MVETEKLIEALTGYRAHLIRRGQYLKAAAVSHCIKLVHRVAASCYIG